MQLPAACQSVVVEHGRVGPNRRVALLHHGSRRSLYGAVVAAAANNGPDARPTSPAPAAASILINQWPSSPEKQPLPGVDWTRYHLQVLFIDSTDTLRARMAAGLFERVAEWNGYGRAMYPWTCGLSAADPAAPPTLQSLTTRAALMHQAYLLGIPPKVFARPAEQFETADLDRYDVVIALDSPTRDSILQQVDPHYKEYYGERVRLLMDYTDPACLDDQTVLRRGGTALLPRGMSQQLQPFLQQLRAVTDIQRPQLSEATDAAVQAWNVFVLSCMLGCAGLVKYLIDQYPPDLPHYDSQ